jgi:predicted SprT family Zn-dependent metalloprotease
METVGSVLILHELYEQVETAVYENHPKHARKVMIAIGDWPIGHSRSMNTFGSVRLSKDPKRRILKMSSFAMSSAAYNDTLLHEVAHIIAWMVADDRSHGYFWKFVASSIGATPHRLGHDIKFEESVAAHRVRKTKLVAKCSDCGQTWYRQRSLKKARSYHCPDCNGNVIKY